MHYRRSRRLSLRVKPNGEVVVGAPVGVSRYHTSQFVNSRMAWIAAQRLAFEKLYDFRRNPQITPELKLHVATGLSPKSSIVRTGLIEVTCPSEFTGWQIYDLARADIRRELKYFAGQRLPLELQTLSQTTGLEPKSNHIKFMRSRWGSCSADGRIALNSQLMRLPRALREYIIVHELCHLQVRNHSAEFYDLLSGFMPKAPKLRASLKTYRLYS